MPPKQKNSSFSTPKSSPTKQYTSVRNPISSPLPVDSPRSSIDSAPPMSTGYSQLIQREEDDKFESSAANKNGKVQSVPLASTASFNHPSSSANSNANIGPYTGNTCNANDTHETNDNDTITDTNNVTGQNSRDNQNSPKPLLSNSSNDSSDENDTQSESCRVQEYYHDDPDQCSHVKKNNSNNKLVPYRDDESLNSTSTRKSHTDNHDDDDISHTESPRLLRSRSVVSFKTINGTVDRLVRDLRCKFHKYAHWRTSDGSNMPRPNEIYYSVFKPPVNQPYTFNLSIEQLQHGQDGYITPEHMMAQEKFDAIVEDAVDAMKELHIQPKLISQGSSGSYFVYNSANTVVGVFKPKDEEPYGPLSPKWTKWIHRNLFPCFFGRSCLIPNNGYIAEAAASLLDRQLGTNIVPLTDVVYFSSPSFYYKFFEQRNFRLKGKPLPNKVGSFQLFLHDYVQADHFLRDHPFTNTSSSSSSRPLLRTFSNITSQPGSPKKDQEWPPQFEWTPHVIAQFREEIEKLVILDYIMRNTDRGLDNWMVKLEWREMDDYGVASSSSTSPNSSSPTGSPTTSTKKTKWVPHLRLGAIDSGLAFPWKHPDEWRSYPFGWLFLPMILIGQPFSTRTREHFLPLLSSSEWWEESALLFRQLFSQDTEFSERMFKRQWAVIKGQAFNVVETLKDPEQGPLELVRRTRVMVWDDEMDVPVKVPYDNMSLAMDTPLWTHNNNSSSAFAYPKMPVPSVEAVKQSRNISSNTNHALKSSLTKNVDSEQRLPTTSDNHNLVPDTAPTRPKNRKRGSSLTLEAKYRQLEQNSESSKRGPVSVHTELISVDGNNINGNSSNDAGSDSYNTQVNVNNGRFSLNTNSHERPQFEDLLRVSSPPLTNTTSNKYHEQYNQQNTQKQNKGSTSDSSNSKQKINKAMTKKIPKLKQYRDNPEDEEADSDDGEGEEEALLFVDENEDVNNDTNDMGFSIAEDSSQATKKVIVERLQTVTSKPPVFTWC